MEDGKINKENDDDEHSDEGGKERKKAWKHWIGTIANMWKRKKN